MILLDCQFGLAAVKIENYFHEGPEFGLELATYLSATVGNLEHRQ